jgi:hypothetical protein
MRARLTAGQLSREPWTVEAAAAFRSFQRQAGSALAGVHLSDPECFKDGCIITALYPDHARYEAMNAQFPKSAAFQKWPGGKYRSAPIPLAQGGEEADWVLFNPNVTREPVWTNTPHVPMRADPDPRKGARP